MDVLNPTLATTKLDYMLALTLRSLGRKDYVMLQAPLPRPFHPGVNTKLHQMLADISRGSHYKGKQTSN